MDEKLHVGEYGILFSGGSASGKRAEALEKALDIRKFEIELYWKRGTYFWTFIAAAFAGYFALEKVDSDGSAFPEYVLACLGFVFSLAWYLVNRGSKYWQQNWEAHVDALEDDVTGPLYKVTFDKKSLRFWNLAGAYPFSPSKLNQILSLFVTGIWLLLIGTSLYVIAVRGCNECWVALILAAMTVVFSLWLVFGGQTSQKDQLLIFRIRKKAFSDGCD